MASAAAVAGMHSAAPLLVWLLLAWIALAVLVGVLLGRALGMSETRDWLRRGSPERRGRPRVDDHETWLREGRSARRTCSPAMERRLVAAWPQAAQHLPDPSATSHVGRRLAP